MRAALVVLALLLAGCSAPDASRVQPAGGAILGGSVLDAPGYFASASLDATSVENVGGAVVLSGSIQDNNSETDVAFVRGWLNGTTSLGSNHTVSDAERAAASEPAGFGADGFKVWTGSSPVDGLLFFRWRVALPDGTPPGLETVSASEGNPGSVAWSAPLALNVTKTAQVAVASAPVSWEGVAQPNASWGAWTATPGATSVVAANYLKITNVGALARPKVVLDFNELAFIGANDPAYAVPVNGNVDFAWWEDATPSVTSPSEGTYAWTTSADGSATLQFNGVNDVIYVTYRVKQLPAVLASQPYAATFTLTDAGGDDGANALPDLVVESLGLPSGAVAGDAVAFSATIRNVGFATASLASIPVKLTLDGSAALTATYNASGPLAPGARATVTSVAWTATKGAHTLSATVDPTSLVGESAEGNNVLADSFQVAAGLADPGFAYEDVACDGVYETGVDVSIASSAVRDGAYDARGNCLVVPPSVGDVSTNKAVNYHSTAGVTVQVNVTSTGNALTLDGGTGFVRALGVALQSKTALQVKSTGGDLDVRGSTLASTTDQVLVSTAGAGVVRADAAKLNATKTATLKAAGAALNAPGLQAYALQGIALTSRGAMDLRSAILNATSASITLSTTISAQQVLVDAAEFHDADNKAALTPSGDTVVGTPAFGSVA